MSNPYAPPPADRPTPDPRQQPLTPPGPQQLRPAPQRPPVPPQHTGPTEPPEPPDPALVLETGRLVRLFGIWMIAAVLVSMLPLPWGAAAVLFLVGAVVTGIRALRTASRGRVGGALAPMVVVGLALAGLLGLMTLAPLALWPAQSALQDCLGSAVTESARTSCQVEYEQRSTELMEGWLGGSGS